jgi:hypothetical protein
MLVIGAQDAVNLLRFFDDLPDPRSSINRLHRLGDVIVMAICAVRKLSSRMRQFLLQIKLYWIACFGASFGGLIQTA